MLGLSAVVAIGIAWRSVYASNQRELHLRRALEREQDIHACLSAVPARRFSTTDAHPASQQKNNLVERYG